MGALTSEMGRICDDMRRWRGERHGLQKALAEEHRLRGISTREQCAGFHQLRADLARQARQQRLRFLAALRRAVDQQRQALEADLAGAHRAWGGRG